MPIISKVKRIGPNYEIKIMTDSNNGRGCLYYMETRDACVAAAQKSADELALVKVAEWVAQANNPRVARVDIKVEGGGFLVASETGPGTIIRWSGPVAIVAVIS
jgi:hypothetical protein